VDDFHTIVPQSVFIQDLAAAVRRRVVDTDDLDLPEGLTEDAVQAGSQPALHHIDRHDDRNKDLSVLFHHEAYRLPFL